MSQVYEHIRYTVDDAVGWITLHRPERLNAWTNVMERELKHAILAAAHDDAVRAIIVTGAGRGFCAGADMQLLQQASAPSSDAAGSRAAGESAPQGANQGDTQAVREPSGAPSAGARPEAELGASYPGRFGYLLSVAKPVIAAINGPCAGIGLVLTLFCDLRWTSDAALFTTAFSERGLIAEHGSSWLLPRLVGPARALDLLFSARRFKAPEAVAIGLVQEVFPQATFIADVRARARRLTHEVSPRSLAVIKAQVWRSLFHSLDTALEVADHEMRKSFSSEDFKEGIAHFVEKRAARFSGR